MVSTELAVILLSIGGIISCVFCIASVVEVRRWDWVASVDCWFTLLFLFFAVVAGHKYEGYSRFLQDYSVEGVEFRIIDGDGKNPFTVDVKEIKVISVKRGFILYTVDGEQKSTELSKFADYYDRLLGD
jgi:hypothetical protein